VPVTTTVTATFSEAMDPATLTTATVTLVKQGTTTSLPATVVYDGAAWRVALTPSASLEAGVSYTATVKGGAAGAKDLAGNALATDRVWSFTTAAQNTPPTATISQPPTGLTFKVGDTITFSGSATDAEDGTIPAGSLSWEVRLQHCPGGSCHVHPITMTTGSGGSFTVQDHGDDIYYEIILTATDSGGLKDKKTIAIHPQTVKITLATSPAGLQVVYNGEAGTAPLTRTAVVGGRRTIHAPSPQGNQAFVSWSDGGAQQHDIIVGASDATYTATFMTVTDATPPVISALAESGITATGATISWTTNEPADTQVEYGTTPSYGLTTPLAPALVTSHSQKLTGLTPNTVYHYRVRSRDAAGNLSTATGSFRTRPR
jgi:hypothetical protein